MVFFSFVAKSIEFSHIKKHVFFSFVAKSTEFSHMILYHILHLKKKKTVNKTIENLASQLFDTTLACDNHSNS